MQKLKEIYHSYFWLILIVWFIIFAAIVFWIGSAYETSQFEQTITNQQSLSNKARSEAVNAQNAAVNASIERSTEDTVRERTVQPKLDEARRRSQISKAELEQARKTYNDKKNISSNLSRSDSDNCLKLKQLFPDTTFEYCQ